MSSSPPPLSHDEVATLLGAYALDAVDPAEAEAVERHLAGCPRCQAEVAAHRETAALLGNVGAEAPAAIWEGIQAAISSAGERTGAPMPRLLSAPRPRRPLALVLSAAAIAAALVLGAVTIRLEHRVNNLHHDVAAGGPGQAAAAALLDPEHRDVHLASPDGQVTALVVVRPGGAAYVIDAGLPELPTSRTYQLWGQTGHGVVSLGLLGGTPRLAAFRIDTGVSRLMVTAEPAGGVPAPDSPVLVQGPVPTA